MIVEFTEGEVELLRYLLRTTGSVDEGTIVGAVVDSIVNKLSKPDIFTHAINIAFDSLKSSIIDKYRRE